MLREGSAHKNPETISYSLGKPYNDYGPVGTLITKKENGNFLHGKNEGDEIEDVLREEGSFPKYFGMKPSETLREDVNEGTQGFITPKLTNDENGKRITHF